jgi:hypothetical protein
MVNSASKRDAGLCAQIREIEICFGRADLLGLWLKSVGGGQYYTWYLLEARLGNSMAISWYYGYS